MYIAELCVKKPVFATMLVTFFVVLGLFSYRDLGVDLFPKADVATVSVSVRLPGASAEELTSEVVKPLEGVLNTISGLDELSAKVNENSADITCRFVLDRDLEGAAQDVREKVAGAMRSLPSDMDPPVVRKQDPDAGSILSLNIASNRSPFELTQIIQKQIVEPLQTVDGVGNIDIGGDRTREIHILMDAEKLAAYGISPAQVKTAVQNENVEAAGGMMVRGTSEVALRTLGRIDAISQFSNIVVTNVKGTPIKISDIGSVEDTYAEPTSYAALDGVPAFSVDISRQSGTNTVEVVDGVMAKMALLKRTLPTDIKIEVIKDNSQFIRASIRALLEHLILGSLFAGLIIFFFIRDWRTFLISFLAIPTSIISTFTAMKFLGFTLNSMTLLALTLSVGIVIDDAIVVLENIYRYIEEKHYPPVEAAIVATKEVGLAVMATTLSLVIIFLPIAFIQGFARRFLYSFGLTMAVAVLVSLLVSFTLTPMLSSRLLKRVSSDTDEGEEDSSQKHSHHGSKEGGFYHWVDDHYGRMLEWSLDHRWSIVAISLFVALSTVPLNRLAGRDWVPADDESNFDFVIDTPEGTSMEGTAEVDKQIADELWKYKDLGIKHLRPTINTKVNHSHTTVILVDPTQRKLTNVQIAERMRSLYPTFFQYQPRINIPSALGGGETQNYPIQMTLTGPDNDKLSDFAKHVTEIMLKNPGLEDTYQGISISHPEIHVQLDRAKAADLGVRVSDVSGSLRSMISGQEKISSYKEGDEQFDVMMLLKEDQRNDPAILGSLSIPTAGHGFARLDSFATLERGVGPTQINRYNRQYTVQIYANLKDGYTIDKAVPDLRAEIQKLGVPLGDSYRFTGNVKNLDETTANLTLALLLSAIFMYMVLAAQFESFKDPFVIMLALPLSIPCALLTLFLTGKTLNLWSALGVLLLFGIVKKNGILQIDYTNKLRALGKPLREAIIEANHTRLRPILMTTASIIFGLLPTAIGLGAGSAQRSAIAITIIGGQMLCLLLTLLLTPVAYSLAADMAASRAWARVRGVFGGSGLSGRRSETLRLIGRGREVF
jgi:HAE1 family hydrophobic/amphiphilic exporter-1